MATASVPSVDRRKPSHLIGVLTLIGPAPLSDTGYNLTQPISVQLERDEGGRVVVSEANTGAFYSDVNLPQALAGFIGAFVEEFEFLVAHESSLSPVMALELERFRMLIEPSVK